MQKKFLCAFMEESGMQNNSYYKSVYKLFSAFEEKLPINKISSMFPKELLNQFSSILNIFAHITFPTCPECCLCPLNKQYLTKENYKNALTIAKKMKLGGHILQDMLKEILE